MKPCVAGKLHKKYSYHHIVSLKCKLIAAKSPFCLFVCLLLILIIFVILTLTCANSLKIGPYWDLFHCVFETNNRNYSNYEIHYFVDNGFIKNSNVKSVNESKNQFLGLSNVFYCGELDNAKKTRIMD